MPLWPTLVLDHGQAGVGSNAVAVGADHAQWAVYKVLHGPMDGFVDDGVAKLCQAAAQLLVDQWLVWSP